LRNDALLSTGLNSASSRRLAERNKKLKLEKEKTRSVLTPAAEVILKWIDQEKKDVVDLSKIILNMESEDNVRAQLLAKQMHLEFVNKLEMRARNLLRTLPDEEPSDG
jgi:hypothetical protein